MDVLRRIQKNDDEPLWRRVQAKKVRQRVFLDLINN